MTPEKKRLYKLGYILALITIFYNLIEGIVSIIFGIEDETITLFGFGIDSFVEVLSGVGIYHMIKRIRKGGNEDPDKFERGALRITALAFFILAGGLFITAVNNLFLGHAPETTFWGIIIASISILTMWLLIYFKRRVGRDLGSDAILADANCTRACLYLSVVLLLASVIYELTGFKWVDSIGAILIGVLSLREGREALLKSRGKKCSCNENHGGS